ncbi:MAG: RDD family protein [Pseudomonadota bacterium]
MMNWSWMPIGRKARKQAEQGPRYGDLYERGLASAIDIIIIFLIFDSLFRGITQRVFSHLDMEKMKAVVPHEPPSVIVAKLWDAHMIQLWTLNFSLQVGIIGLVLVGFQCVYRTTPGKWLFGLKVVEKDTLLPAARWRLVLRFIGYMLAGAPLMIGFMWMSFNRRHRGWHDYIAGTVVLNTRPRGWYWAQVKRGYYRLRGKSAPEQPVRQPAAEQGHADGKDAVE